MSLREEFEKEVIDKNNGVLILFETSNQKYITWLENRINQLSQTKIN